jgi:hypothetical protein
LEEVAYWVKQGVWPDASIVLDPYFSRVSLLLSSTALGNANNNLFVDSSGAFNPISRNGNATQGSFSPYGSDWSNYFDGSSDYFSVPYTSANFDWWSTDFTIEAWVYPTGLSTWQDERGYSTMVGNVDPGGETNYWSFGPIGNGTVRLYYYNGSQNTVTSTATISENAWSHIALTKTSAGITIYVNGVASTTTAVSGTPQSSTSFGLVVGQSFGRCLTGNISNLRIVRGTAVYTGNFTPPTSALTAVTNTKLLTCQSNRFRDISPNNLTLTVTGGATVSKISPFAPAAPGITYNQNDIQYWSGHFDGNDWLSIADNDAFDFGTGDFTIETWAYFPSTGNTVFVAGWTTGEPVTGWSFGTDTSNGFYFVSAVSTSYSPVAGNAAARTLGVWHHVAVVRSSGNVTVYVNGVGGTPVANAQNITTAATGLNIGRSPYTANPAYFTGYLSNLRIVKGTAVYTANFTPPTAPLTAISGTSLLTCQNAAFTDNSTNNFAITINGNSTVTGNNPFQTGYYSNYFDGVSANLTLPSSSQFAIATSTTAFTIEAWIYPTAAGSCIFTDVYTGAGNSIPICISMSNGVQVDAINGQYIALGYYTGSAWVTAAIANAQVSLNTWTHIACVFTGSTTKIYYNGVDVTKTSSPTPAATWGVTGSNGDGWYVGRRWDGSGNNFFAGYISNLRFVNGTAVYTAAFTPPTSPLTAITNTVLLTCQSSRFIDNSTNNFAITLAGAPTIQSFDPFYTSTIASNGGSMYFDGSGDYLALQNSLNYALGSGDFTLEVWVYPIVQGGHGSSNNDCIIDFRPGSNGAYGTLYSLNNGASINWYANTGVRITGGAIPNGAWSHLCVSRVSGNTRLFINGVQSGSTYVDSTNYLQTNPWIGQFNDSVGSGWFQGYMSGMRIVKGSGVSTTFTPPTAPVTPTAATTLLLNGMNAGIYDATGINDLETVGDAKVSTAVSKFGGSSIAFDGTGDRILAAPSEDMNLASGDWTIEFWVYTNTVAAGNAAIVARSAAGNIATGDELQWSFYRSGSTLYARPYKSTTDYGISLGTISTGTWYHVAMTRSGNTIRAFLNGTVSATTQTISGALNNNTAWYGIIVGGLQVAGVNEYWNGYIDDLRITKGYARYTANFTPPDKAFPTY